MKIVSSFSDPSQAEWFAGSAAASDVGKNDACGLEDFWIWGTQMEIAVATQDRSTCMCWPKRVSMGTKPPGMP